MSRDDTIGIFKLKRDGKTIYIVIHDQCIEDYEFIEYMYHKNTITPLKWTYSFHTAMNIAKLIYIKNPDCEYGIKVFNIHKNIEFNN